MPDRCRRPCRPGPLLMQRAFFVSGDTLSAASGADIAARQSAGLNTACALTRKVARSLCFDAYPLQAYGPGSF